MTNDCRIVSQSAQNGVVTPLVVLYDTFFARLFLLEPSMRKMFEDNMVRQSKFLVGLVNLLVRQTGEMRYIGEGGSEIKKLYYPWP